MHELIFINLMCDVKIQSILGYVVVAHLFKPFQLSIFWTNPIKKMADRGDR